jgi:hypothetical protein
MKNATPTKTHPKSTHVSPPPVGNWVARINAALKVRAGAEREIAAALAEHKQKVGTKRWLEDCEREWGWSSSTAYRHLDPKQMEAARAHTCAAAASPKVGTKSQPVCAECGQVSSGSWQTHTAGCSKETTKQKETRAIEAAYPRPALVPPPPPPSPRKKPCKDCGMSSMHRLECSQYDHAARAERQRWLMGGVGPEQQEQQRAAERAAMAEDARQHRTQQLQDNLRQLAGLVVEIEASHTLLTPRYVEMLCTAWDKIGAMIERHSHDGAITNGEPEGEAVAVL